MAGRYQNVFTRLWANPEFRAWAEPTRYAALYVLTCEHRTTEGLFRLPLAFAAYELQWTPEQTETVFAELEAAGFIALDRDADLVWLVNAIKWNQPKGIKQMTGAVNSLKKVPDSPLKARYLDHCRLWCADLADALESAGFVPPQYRTDRVSEGYTPSSSSSSSGSSSTPQPRSDNTKDDDSNSAPAGRGGGGYPHPAGPMDPEAAIWHSAMDRLGFASRREPTTGQLRTIALALDQGWQPDHLTDMAERALDAGSPVEYLVGAWRNMGQAAPEANVTNLDDRRPEIPDYQPDDTPRPDPTEFAAGAASARAALDK